MSTSNQTTLHLLTLPAEIRHKILTHTIILSAYEFADPFGSDAIPFNRPLMPIYSRAGMASHVGIVADVGVVEVGHPFLLSGLLTQIIQWSKSVLHFD